MDQRTPFSLRTETDRRGFYPLFSTRAGLPACLKMMGRPGQRRFAAARACPAARDDPRLTIDTCFSCPGLPGYSPGVLPDRPRKRGISLSVGDQPNHTIRQGHSQQYVRHNRLTFRISTASIMHTSSLRPSRPGCPVRDAMPRHSQARILLTGPPASLRCQRTLRQPGSACHHSAGTPPAEVRQNRDCQENPRPLSVHAAWRTAIRETRIAA